uniref:Uncharacterized protein n=1 Tax=Molossus molossus TaxID=27622 RepID=A0A7J8IZL8_MOLMO|nr:hypothetical protein HJG59_010398 [Molossus molossus]
MAMLSLPPVEEQRVVEAAPRPRGGLGMRPSRRPCCSLRRPHCSALTVPRACGQALCLQLGARPTSRLRGAMATLGGAVAKSAPRTQVGLCLQRTRRASLDLSANQAAPDLSTCMELNPRQE